jgi:hypothetical protein
LNRFIVAIAAAFLAAMAYAFQSYATSGVIAPSGEAILVASSTFGFVISFVVMVELARAGEEDLGLLRNSRAALIAALLFTCVYMPLSIAKAFTGNSVSAAGTPAAQRLG